MSGASPNKKKKTKVVAPENPPSTPVDFLLKLFREQKNCDVLFRFGQGKDEKKIGAHRLILKGRSSYFETMFSKRWENNTASNSEDGKSYTTIKLKNENPSIFRLFLEHIYAYVCSVRPVDAMKLLRLSQFYDVPSLAKSCEEILAKPFQVDELLDIFFKAKEFDMPSVEAKAGEAMANYYPQLENSTSFETVDEATLIYLLERDDLNIEEFDLFSSLLRWADKRIEGTAEEPKPTRDVILKNLIPLIRFPTMDQHDFAEEVAFSAVLPLETVGNVLLYLVCIDEEKKNAVTNLFPYSLTPRKSNIRSIRLYDDKSLPGIGTYPNVALKKSSHVRDIITIVHAARARSSPQAKIISLVLEPPKYGEARIFQNSSEVAGMNLPISVGISCYEINTGCCSHTKIISKEVVVKLGSGETVLMLEKPWVLSFDKAYQITTRFLSEVFTVPEVVDDGSGEELSRRNENFDYLNAAILRDQIFVPLKDKFRIHLSMRGGSCSKAGAGPAAQVVSLTSGLHLIRSIQVADV